MILYIHILYIIYIYIYQYIVCVYIHIYIHLHGTWSAYKFFEQNRSVPTSDSGRLRGSRAAPEHHPRAEPRGLEPWKMAIFPVKNGGLTGKESMRTWRNSSAEMVVHELPGLVNIQKSMENHHSLMGKSAINGNFSIAMFVYQRVSSTCQFVS